MPPLEAIHTRTLTQIIYHVSQIWDIADSNSKGYLTRSGFFVALKLVAVVQAGKEIAEANLSLDVPPPQLVTSFE